MEEWNACWTSEGARFPHGNFTGTSVSHVVLFNWLAVLAFSVPCGFVDGRPVGLQIVGRPGSETTMFQAARALQTAWARHEHPPSAAGLRS